MCLSAILWTFDAIPQGAMDKLGSKYAERVKKHTHEIRLNVNLLFLSHEKDVSFNGFLNISEPHFLSRHYRRSIAVSWHIRSETVSSSALLK